MKKLLIFIITLLFFLLLFTCKKHEVIEDISQNNHDDKIYNVSDKKISLWGWSVGDIEKRLLLEVLKDFERDNPGFTVELKTFDNYNETVLLNMATEEIGDLIYLDSVAAPYFIKNNLLYWCWYDSSDYLQNI